MGELTLREQCDDIFNDINHDVYVVDGTTWRCVVHLLARILARIDAIERKEAPDADD